MVPQARLFFALPVDPPLREQLAARALQVAGEAVGRAVPAANLHATVAFLGSVARAAIASLLALGDGVRAEAFDARLDRHGSFRGARVAWIAPSHVPPAMRALHGAVAQGLAAAGFAVEERPWHPHVTLARHCRRMVPPGDDAPLAWPVRALALYESIGAEGGPRYEPLARWPLAGSTGRDGSAIHSLHDPG
jgi:2'-5' RNA ligase